MATFTVNAQRFDPYKNFKFRFTRNLHVHQAGSVKLGSLGSVTS